MAVRGAARFHHSDRRQVAPGICLPGDRGEFSETLASIEAREKDANEYFGTVDLVRSDTTTRKHFILVPDSDDQVVLYGPLENLTLSTSATAVVPSQQASPVLGPDLFVHCGPLIVQGPAVEFAQRAVPSKDTDDSAGAVILEVSGHLQLPSVIARAPLPGDFELRVPDTTVLHYPWVRYRQELEAPKSVAPSDRAVRFLKMLMNLTRAHGHGGERGTFIMKLQGRQSVKVADFKAVAEILVRRGIARI